MFTRLGTYLSSVQARDPAARSRLEVLIYPGVWALALHRLAHPFYRGGSTLLARCINHFARWLTGIDIHPGAVIGRNFFADHGFAVIGETAVIGNDVTIYSGVTLGGSHPTNGKAGRRHPAIGNGVVIGSGAQVIGLVHVGAGARIAANAVVTKDVPAGAVAAGIPARTLVPGMPRRQNDPGDLDSGLAEVRLRLEELDDRIGRLERRSHKAATAAPHRPSQG